MVGGERGLWVIWMRMADIQCPPPANAKGPQRDTASPQITHKHSDAICHETEVYDGKLHISLVLIFWICDMRRNRLNVEEQNRKEGSSHAGLWYRIAFKRSFLLVR